VGSGENIQQKTSEKNKDAAPEGAALDSEL